MTKSIIQNAHEAQATEAVDNLRITKRYEFLSGRVGTIADVLRLILLLAVFFVQSNALIISNPQELTIACEAPEKPSKEFGAHVLSI